MPDVTNEVAELQDNANTLRRQLVDATVQIDNVIAKTQSIKDQDPIPEEWVGVAKNYRFAKVKGVRGLVHCWEVECGGGIVLYVQVISSVMDGFLEKFPPSIMPTDGEDVKLKKMVDGRLMLLRVDGDAMVPVKPLRNIGSDQAITVVDSRRRQVYFEAKVRYGNAVYLASSYDEDNGLYIVPIDGDEDRATYVASSRVLVIR